MVSFSHLEPGTPEDDWAAADLPATLPALLLDAERIVVVAAHPDDETLGAGGLLVRAAHLGLPITVVVLTSGEASHPDSRTHTAPQLAALREAELTQALVALAPAADVRLVRLPDGGLSDHLDEATQAVRGAIGDGGPGTWVIAPWRADGHPDHTAAGSAAANAVADAHARLLEYPIWAWHWSTPGSDVWAGVWPDVWPHGATLSVLELTSGEHAQKAGALAGFPSQTEELSPMPGDEAVLVSAVLAYFRRDYETFIETSVPAASTELTLESAAHRSLERSEDPSRASTEAKSASAGPTENTRSVAALHGPMAANRSLTEPFFDDFYAGTRDPWGFESRWYERRKQAITLAALPRARFGSVLELGCSVGVFTEQLAGRADTVRAVDISEEPLRIARERLAGRAEVTFEQLAVPRQWPLGAFDLIVLSEVGYFCSTADLRRLLERCRSSLTADGVLLACHWRHPVDRYPLTGDAVHAQLARVAGLQRTVNHVEYDFVLEVFEPRPARSVAQREGLVS